MVKMTTLCHSTRCQSSPNEPTHCHLVIVFFVQICPKLDPKYVVQFFDYIHFGPNDNSFKITFPDLAGSFGQLSSIRPSKLKSNRRSAGNNFSFILVNKQTSIT